MNELTEETFQVARMKLFASDLELILWHFETNNPYIRREVYRYIL